MSYFLKTLKFEKNKVIQYKKTTHLHIGTSFVKRKRKKLQVIRIKSLYYLYNLKYADNLKIIQVPLLNLIFDEHLQSE